MSNTSFDKVKQFLKKGNIIDRLYFSVIASMYKSRFIPNIVPTKLMFWISFGQNFDLKNPKDFNQKIQWIKLKYNNPLYTIGADKYEVRKYIKSKGLDYILNDLYGVYNDIDEVNFDELPNSFVIKGTKIGSILSPDKDKLNISREVAHFKEEFNQDMGRDTGELHYTKIKNKVIVERFLGTKDGTLPLDYKIFCFNGEPYAICVLDRDINTNTTIRYFYDFDWNPLEGFLKKEIEAPKDYFKKPNNLDELYNVAKKLSSPFPFVRVDLYNENNKIIFGELTFTPTGGFNKAYTQKALDLFGEKLTLPINK